MLKLEVLKNNPCEISRAQLVNNEVGGPELEAE